MKKLILSALCFLFINFIYSKNYYTKKEMYKDFDYMYDILKNTCGQIQIRDKLTGDNILFKIQQQREKINLINSSTEFIALLDRCLTFVNDMHCGAITDSVSLANILKNKDKTEKLTETIKHIYNTPEKHKKIPIALLYQNGKYYSVGRFAVIEKDDSICDFLPIGSQIISINGISIDSIVNFNIEKGYSFYRWDASLTKKYIIKRNIYIPVSFDINIITYKFNEEISNLNIKNDKIITISGGGYFYQSFEEQGFVEYFEKDKILYIRLPKMLNCDFYKTEIQKRAKNVPINKIVIDIRHNGGGSDEVFMQILENMIKDTIFVRANIGFKYNPTMTKILSKKYGKKIIKNNKHHKIKLLDDEKYTIVNWGRNLVPNVNSINYGGNIYILQDKFIFSAAGSLSNLAQISDKLVSVGQETGYLLGFGVAPFIFSLPNSGFSFTVESAVDFTNVNQMSDFYHDKVEIPVEISIEDIVRYFNTEEEKLYSTDFLYNHDPVFQKVLEFE
jgi:hypothetical protein